MKETTFRKNFKTQEMNIDNFMDGTSDTSYQFSAAPLFKSPLNQDAGVMLVCSHNHKEDTSLDFLISKDDCVKLIEYFNKIIDFIDERNEVIGNLEERFKIIRDAYEAGELERVDVSLSDENAYGYTGDGNKPCLLKFEPIPVVTCSKFFTTFYAILYVTGVYEADKKIFADVLKDIPLKYDSALKKRGERIKREQYNDALKAIDERTAKMKSEMKK